MIDSLISPPNLANSRIKPMDEALIKQISGLTTVACTTTDLIHDLRDGLIDQGLRGGSDTGISFRPLSVRSFIPGDQRQQRYEAVRRNLSAQVPEGMKFEQICAGTSSSFNFCGVEGRQMLLPYVHTENKVQHPCYYIFGQEIADANNMLLAETLMQFRAAAKCSKTHVIAILACESGFENSQLHELGDEHISVNECEADYGYDRAFEIDVLGLRQLNRLGVGRTMCSMGFANGRVTYEYEPFIDMSARGRAMWWLRAAGRSYAQIGKIFDVNKSTVMRQLKTMPRTRSVEVDEQWLKQLIEHLDSEAGIKANNKKSALDFVDEDDVDADLGEE